MLDDSSLAFRALMKSYSTDFWVFSQIVGPKIVLIPLNWLSRLVGVRFWSLKKANSSEFNHRDIGID